jgi:hypothetical protein
MKGNTMKCNAIAILAAAALALGGLGGAGQVRADTLSDGTHITPVEAAYLAELSRAGVPYKDAKAALLLGYDFCEDALGSRTGSDHYETDMLAAGAVDWTREQNNTLIATATAYLCPEAGR